MKRRIAILGGGMAGLTAAFELTRTEALRRQNEVTVYQMGWRLGGKCASSRDENGRILEHGLHVWFGCYENAFGLLRDVYRDWKRPPDSILRTWRDGFEAHDFTPVGDAIGGRYVYHPVRWPTRPGEPGDGEPLPGPWQALHSLLALARNVVLDWQRRHPAAAGQVSSAPARTSPSIGALIASVVAAAGWAEEVIAGSGATPRSLVDALSEVGAQLRAARQTYFRADIETRVLDQMLDIVVAFARGVAFDLLIGRRSLDDLDSEDFRDWLVRHGGDAGIVRRSDIVKSLYDTMFQYEDGDPSRPSYAAGTAIQVLMRIVTTYKGAVMFLLTAGTGEVVVAPLYEVLRDRGVRFRFFRKVRHLGLSRDRRVVDAIVLDRQAEVRKGAAYQPTIARHGLSCWPAEPDWDQLVDGIALKLRGAEFESHWNPVPPVGRETLRRGADFDQVVLAIPLGAFKPLNEAPGPCDELIAASYAFRNMTDRAGLVPSQAAQFWSTRTLGELGWNQPRPATVSGAPILDIWADMTPTLAVEPRRSGGPGPRSVHYLCSVMNTRLHRRPPWEQGVPAEAKAEVARNAALWLERYSAAVWPAARRGGRFDWDCLHDPGRRRGSARRAAQFVRANINPTDCCIGSPKGSTSWRLPVDGSGFDNLTMAGCWVRTGMNTTCIEAAIMSGRQAARAICGEPRLIPGEDFFRTFAVAPLPDPVTLIASPLRSLLGRLTGTPE